MIYQELADWVSKFDNYGFRLHLAQIEATRFTGADGKEYFRFPSARLSQNEISKSDHA